MTVYVIQQLEYFTNRTLIHSFLYRSVLHVMAPEGHRLSEGAAISASAFTSLDLSFGSSIHSTIIHGHTLYRPVIQSSFT